MTISQEDDKEEYLNSTQNPLNKSDPAILVSSITGEMDNDIWINAKMSTATEIQVVFVSLVRSGLLAQKCRTETGTGSSLF